MDSAEKIFTLSVSLCNIEPPIWRKLLIPGMFTLGDLHLAIQAAMGWQDYHLHEFTMESRLFGPEDLEAQKNQEDENTVALYQLLTQSGDKLRYLYDFGDEWKHEIALEDIVEPDPNLTYPYCIDGGRACPPEDVGGPSKYNNIIKAYANHNSVEEIDRPDLNTVEWRGEGFDPEHFSVEETNRRINTRDTGTQSSDWDLDKDDYDVFEEDDLMWKYDAAKQPEKEKWLLLDEGERGIAAKSYHKLQMPHPEAPNPRVHAFIHSAVETQIAAGDPPETGQALERLLASGLSRHNAIHALGSVITDQLFEVMKLGKPFDRDAYARSMALLTLEKWNKILAAEKTPSEKKSRKKKKRKNRRR